MKKSKTNYKIKYIFDYPNWKKIKIKNKVEKSTPNNNLQTSLELPFYFLYHTLFALPSPFFRFCLLYLFKNLFHHKYFAVMQNNQKFECFKLTYKHFPKSWLKNLEIFAISPDVLVSFTILYSIIKLEWNQWQREVNGLSSPITISSQSGS